jgi:hypothetical protein
LEKFKDVNIKATIPVKLSGQLEYLTKKKQFNFTALFVKQDDVRMKNPETGQLQSKTNIY